MLFETRQEADDYIAQLTKSMVITDTFIVEGVEKIVYSIDNNGVDDKSIEVNIAPAGTVFDEEIMNFFRDDEDGVELIFGDIEDYTSDRIVIVSDIEDIPGEVDEDGMVDPDLIP